MSDRDRPRYRTWVRTKRLSLFALLTAGGIAVSALAVLSPWFLIALVPTAAFGYITAVLTTTAYRLGPRGGDAQRRIHELIAAKAEPQQRRRALDIGCGSGSLVVTLARAGATNVTGVDSWGPDWQYSKQLCEDNARAEGATASTTFDVQDGGHLDFPDATFDLVVSCMAFHEMRALADTLDGVREALRVLEPGGRFVFVDLFSEPAHYGSLGDVQRAISDANATATEIVPLTDALALTYPLTHPKVLGRAGLVVGTKHAPPAPIDRQQI